MYNVYTCIKYNIFIYIFIYVQLCTEHITKLVVGFNCKAPGGCFSICVQWDRPLHSYVYYIHSAVQFNIDQLTVRIRGYFLEDFDSRSIIRYHNLKLLPRYQDQIGLDGPPH